MNNEQKSAGISRREVLKISAVTVAGACTHFGKLTYQMQYDSNESKVAGEVTFAEHSSAAWAVLHIRMPEGLKVTSVDQESKATVTPDGSGLRWTAPRGILKFRATIGI